MVDAKAESAQASVDAQANTAKSSVKLRDERPGVAVKADTRDSASSPVVAGATVTLGASVLIAGALAGGAAGLAGIVGGGTLLLMGMVIGILQHG